MKKYKVLHFVYGGGSGATRRAEELAIGNHYGDLLEPYIVYRGAAKLSEKVKKSGVKYKEVASKKFKKKMINELIEIINRFKPDIVVAHGYKDHIYGRIAALKAKVPIIIQVERNAQPYIISYYLMAQVLTIFTDKIVCVSNAVKDHLVKRLFNKSKMHVIYNGLHLENYYNEKPLTERISGVVMVARFCTQKDHETLIKAAKIIKDRGIDCPIYLVGDGKAKHVNRMEQLCKTLEVTDVVHFLGTRNDVPELLSTYQISVLSTHYEGLSGVVLESMAAGNVVIATDAPGVYELIDDGKTGFLVPPKSSDILAEKIISVMKEPSSFSHIVENAQKHALENFNIDNMVQKYEELFYDLLKKKGI